MSEFPPFAEKGFQALRKAVADTVEEHRRLGLPLVIWRDGKVVEVMADELDQSPAKVQEQSEEPGGG